MKERGPGGLQEAVLELALALGWLAYHTYDSRRSAPGFPDLVLVRAPRLLFVELKGDGGEVSPDQKVWAAELERVAEALAGMHALDGADAVRLVDYHEWWPDDWISGRVEAHLRWRA